MAFDIAKEHLRKAGLEDRIYEFEVSSATVELAAQAVGCEPARIAKTLSFMACLLYTSPSPRDRSVSRMPSSA